MSLVANADNSHGLDVYALRLLIDKKVGNPLELERWRQFKAEQLSTRLAVLNGVT